MEPLSVEFWIQLIVYAVSFGIVFGQFQTKIKYIEKQLEKHNHFTERLYKVEESTKAAHSRIDEIKEELR